MHTHTVHPKRKVSNNSLFQIHHQSACTGFFAVNSEVFLKQEPKPHEIWSLLICYYRLRSRLAYLQFNCLYCMLSFEMSPVTWKPFLLWCLCTKYWYARRRCPAFNGRQHIHWITIQTGKNVRLLIIYLIFFVFCVFQYCDRWAELS